MSGLRPYPVYLFISGAFGLFFMLYATIASVYRIKTVGLDPLQLVGTALELAILIFEVPTGALSAAATPENETEDASKAHKKGNFVNSDRNCRSFVD